MMLFWLLVGHCVADYPLQGDFLARAKNQTAPIPGIDWQIALVVHSLIHAGAVMLITGIPALAVLEFVAHVSIDYGKCAGAYDFKTDQAFHVVCKIVWVALLNPGWFA